MLALAAFPMHCYPLKLQNGIVFWFWDIKSPIRRLASVGSTVRVQQRNDKCVTSVRQCGPFHRLDCKQSKAGVPQNALNKPTPF
jgi:hypothetical protein